MPLYPTPNRDDGYDITDYLGVDPRLGDLGEVVEAIRHATDRGLRVLADLVVNHTSDEHPWFRAACADRRSPYRDFYVWTDDPGREEGTSKENWAWSEEAGQCYMHQFAPFQPDLNIADPAVRDEIAKTVGFWLKLGVSGFRMDAVPFLVQELDARGDEESRRGQALAARAARVRDAPAGRCDAHGRVQRRHGRGAVVLRGPRRRPAPPARLPRQPAAVARAGPRRGCAAREPDPRAAAPPARLWLGDVPAQPRRAHPGQARRDGARRGLRRLRARRGHADLRSRDPPAGRVDARRRRAAAADGVVAHDEPARIAGDPLRRRDRDGRGPRPGRPDGRPDADAVGAGAGRRVLGGADGAARASRPPRARSARTR